MTIDKAAEAVCDVLSPKGDNPLWQQHMQDGLVKSVAAIIKRELEKAVPAAPVMPIVSTLDDALTKARHEAINECRKRIGLGE